MRLRVASAIGGGIILGSILWSRKAYASMYPVSSTPPEKSKVIPATIPAPPSTGPNASGIYTTARGAIVQPPIVSFTRKSGKTVRVTAIPALDSRAKESFARLTYAESADYVRSIGASLLTTDLCDELYQAGIQIAPCILPPTAQMGSLAWADRFDACAFAELHSAGWDGKQLAGGAWKDWIAGAPAGRALNYGFYSREAPNGKMWQSLGTKHDSSHTDYSQLLRYYWEG